MKGLRYIALVLCLLLIVAGTVAYVQRERVASGIANRILSESGFRVEDIGLARLRANELRLSRLAIRGDDGTRYIARDVTLGLDLADTRITRAEIGRLEILPAADSPPSALVNTLDTAFDLPQVVPDIEVDIGRVEHPAFGAVREVRWETANNAQHAAALVGGVRVALDVASETATDHLVDVIAESADAAPGTARIVGSQLRFERLDEAYAAGGDLVVDTGSLLTLLQDHELLDLSAATITGEFAGRVRADIGAGLPGTVDIVLSGADSAPLAFRYDAGPEVPLTLRSADIRIETLRASYPALDWAISLGDFALALDGAYFDQASARIADLKCDASGQCTGTASLQARKVAYDDYRVGQLSMGGSTELSFGEETLLRFRPVSFAARELAGDGWTIAAAELTRANELLLAAGAAAANFSAQRMVIRVADLATPDEFRASTDVDLQSVRYAIDTGAGRAKLELPQSTMRLSWRQYQLTPASIRGDVRLDGDTTTLAVNITDASRGLTAAVNLRSGADAFAVELGNASIDFSAAPASASLAAWPFDWNVVAGTATVAGALSTADSGYTGDFDVKLTGMAGNAGDIGAAGAAADFEVDFRPDRAPRIGPGELHVDLLEVGLPIRNIEAVFDWDTATANAAVERLEMELLGGSARAEPFRIDVDDLDTRILLHVEAVQLGLIAQLAEFDDIELSGALSGMIPVQMNNGRLTVENGRLDSLAPGGVIRYHSQPADPASSLGLAQRALSNLQYETLGSDVAYTPEGDLKLQMRLKGINPDLDPLQPVILNLGVENNIPQLLRSLQATRDIEAIIESRSRR